jgi:hypothetical protein
MGAFYHRPMRTRASRDTSPCLALQPLTMQPEQSTSAQGSNALTCANEEGTSEHIHTTVTSSKQLITWQFFAAKFSIMAQF